MGPMQPVTSTFTTTAINELRTIADHTTRTPAWSQLSWSFDRLVRTGDINP